MKKLLFASVALGALAAAGSANAADVLPVYKAPPPVAAPASWAGLYIGVNAGGGMATGDFLDMDCFTCADVTFHRGFGEVGGQIGYNWQWGSAVVGIEGDLNRTSATGNHLFALDDGNSAGTTQFKFDAFGSVRARAGLAFDRTLVYVTAGPAWGHFNSVTNVGGIRNPILDVATDDSWHLGLAAGAGVEFMLAPHWSLRGEYLFLDFHDRVVNFVPTPNGNPADARFRENYGYSAQVARVGLNYRFDPGAPPATSAYAADLRAPIYKAPVAPAVSASWAGLYLGVNAGGGMADAKFLDMDCFSCANATFHRGFGEVGGQIGYNWQWGSTVLGVEGDLNWASVNQSGILGLPGFGIAQFATTQFKFDAFATLRARAGVAVDRSLVYVTAGPAWGHFDSVTTPHIGSLGGPVRDTITDDSWHVGLAVGAGVEYMLAPHWLVRGEYLHLAFTDKIVNAVPVGGPAADALARMSYAYSAHVARLGLNYKFDDAGAATYARPLGAPVYKAPPAPAVNWAGLYIGANAGGGIANADLWDMDCYSCTDVTFHRGFAEVGGQIGYNWQWASTVLGVEGDLNWASANESAPRGVIEQCCAGTSQFKFDAFGSVRARLGLAADRALLYVTAGPAWGHFNSAVNSVGFGPFAQVFTITDNSWHVGAAVGAGMEYMLSPSWSIRGEYLYLNFVDKVASCVPLNAAAVNCASFYHINFANSAQIARVGLNYKLDWLAPVVAKY